MSFWLPFRNSRVLMISKALEIKSLSSISGPQVCDRSGPVHVLIFDGIKSYFVIGNIGAGKSTLLNKFANFDKAFNWTIGEH